MTPKITGEIEPELKKIFTDIRKRKFPYARLNSPHLISGDCYNWDRIENDILKLFHEQYAKQIPSPE